MSDDTNNEAGEAVKPVKRTIADVKRAAGTAAKQDKPAKSAPAKRAQRAADPVKDDEVPELKATPQAKDDVPENYRWVAYLGHKDRHLCYRTSAPLLFAPQTWSNGHPVALVHESFGEHLIETCALKHDAKGASIPPEQWTDLYAWYDDVADRRVHAVRRYAGAR